MGEGSPEISVWLPPECGGLEIGRGVATRRTFVWTLSTDELGHALHCGLVVRAAKVHTDHGLVRKVATLAVSPDISTDAPIRAFIYQGERVEMHARRGDKRIVYALAYPDLARLVVLQRPAFVSAAGAPPVLVMATLSVGGVEIESPDANEDSDAEG
jgi:hypothetical protein